MTDETMDEFMLGWIKRFAEELRAPLREAIAKGLEERAKYAEQQGYGDHYVAALQDAAERVRLLEWEADIELWNPKPKRIRKREPGVRKLGRVE